MVLRKISILYSNKTLPPEAYPKDNLYKQNRFSVFIMVLSQRRPKRTATGSRYKKDRRKRLFEKASHPIHTKIDDRKAKVVRTKGGNKKFKLLRTKIANVIGKDKKCYKVEITNVLENPADRQLVRRNIITKGCIIETEKGNAKVTSRPGQDGTINAVLIE